MVSPGKSSLADRLLGVYMDVSNARQSLELVLSRAEPKDTQCSRFHQVVRTVKDQILKDAADEVAMIVQDLKSWEYMQLKDSSPDGADGWKEK